MKGSLEKGAQKVIPPEAPKLLTVAQFIGLEPNKPELDVRDVLTFPRCVILAKARIQTGI